MKPAILYLEKPLAFLEALDKPIREQIHRKIGKLAENPELGEPLSNALKGTWKLHIGKYRVIYVIDGNSIIIAKIGHRKDVYE